MNRYASSRKSGPGQLAIDFEQEMADLLPTLITYLRGEPDVTEMAQELTMGFLRDFQARWVHFGVLQDDAALRVLGAFGLPLDASTVWEPISLWSALPMAEAVRTKECSVLLGRAEDAHEVPTGFWVQEAPPSVVAVPLSTSTKTVGAMTVGFDGQVAPGSSLIRHLEAIADVLVLYLASLISQREPDPQAPSQTSPASGSSTSNGDQRRRSEVKISELTRRQKTILALLADGLTYDQIGSRIGFSHSTVRMELMHIYRYFDVSSRDAAVEVALKRGLLKHQEINEDVYSRQELLSTLLSTDSKTGSRGRFPS
jgi:DNA-binding CsgD family transcriptional regulator